MTPLYVVQKILNTALIAIVVTLCIHLILQAAAWASGTNNPILIDTINRFSIDAELSVPAWLSSTLALIVAMVSLAISRLQTTHSASAAWLFLSLLLFFISVDEVAALHELALQALHILSGLGVGQTYASNALLFVVPFIALGFVLSMMWWSRHLPKITFLRILVGFGVFALGALLVEYVSIEADKLSLSYILIYVTIEETLEFLGLWLILRAVLLHAIDSETTIQKLFARSARPTQ